MKEVDKLVHWNLFLANFGRQINELLNIMGNREMYCKWLHFP